MIYITENEFRSNIPSLLEKLGIRYERANLQVGDYFVGKIDSEYSGIPVERKAIKDYFASLNDGRRDEQLYNLSFNFPLSYLVVIGTPSFEVLRGGHSLNAYVSSLVGSSLKRAPDGQQGQVITIILETDYEFALFLKYLDEKFTSGDFIRVPKLVRHGKSPEEMLLFVVMSLPHCGEITGRALLEKFGTLRRLFSASESDLQEVKGIGKKTAFELYSLFNLQYEDSASHE
jgi:ERCC4-type nuclease